MFNKYFGHYEKILNIQFNLIREKYLHRGIKGSCIENILRDFINLFLPTHLNVGHGEVIDSFGRRSKQTDIIIVNNTQKTFISDYNAPNIFIIESVTCAGEVKSRLSSLEDLIEIIDECNVFKFLSPNFLEGDMIVTNLSDRIRFYEKRPFFAFVFGESLQIPSIIEALNAKYEKTSVTEQIDAIFILEKGVIINFGDGTGALKFIEPNTRKAYEGFVHVSNEDVLRWFSTWMIAVMPQIVSFTHPIINYLFQSESVMK